MTDYEKIESRKVTLIPIKISINFFFNIVKFFSRFFDVRKTIGAINFP